MAVSFGSISGWDSLEQIFKVGNYTWDTGTLQWIKQTSAGGGGGGGPVTIVDGGDVNSGSTTDAAVITNTTGTLSGKLRGLVKWAFERMPASLGQLTMAESLSIAFASDQTDIPLTGTKGNNTATPSTTNIGAITSLVTVGAQAYTPGRLALHTVNSSGELFTVIRDGADSNSGNTTDVAATSDANATSSAKLRGLVKWAYERNPASLGQKVMTASFPVVLASDQSIIPVAATQSGTWTVQQGTPPWSVSQSGAWSVSVTGTATISGTVSTKTDLTPSSPTSVSVGVASASAVAANATRKGLVLINLSSARISFGFGSTAVLDSGITLYPGDSYSMDEYSFDLGVVNAIASAAASSLAVQEYS
jgi:hypothetical protein